MGRRGALGAWHRLTVAAVALYAVFLATSPFEHHDLLCHLKTPQHCTSCASSPLSVHPTTPTTLDGCRLADAGRTVSSDLAAHDTQLRYTLSGRSPPARS